MMHIIDEYRRVIWTILVGVTQEEKTEPSSLDELSTHSEYNQVVLDVNRSLKRFPPGISYEQRVALQDQLTVLILRVIIKYPHLKYYQGYHDVAITLLLVCGDRASYPMLCRLSHGPKAPLAPFMQTTMQPTQHLLNYMLPVIGKADCRVAECLEKAEVGTMFALPWFLCSPPMFPLYVAASVVLHRADEVFDCDCDMAMLHCLLSRVQVVGLKTPVLKFHPKPPKTVEEEEELNDRRTVFPKDTRAIVTPVSDVLFKAKEDAKNLHKAIEGVGTNEDAIIRILTKRSLEQRLQIADAYKKIFGYVLTYHLALETSGSFRKLLSDLLTPVPLLYARGIRDAIVGFGTTEKELIEIICMLTNHEIIEVEKTYENEYNSLLTEDIREDTSGQFQELLITLLKANRSEELVVYPKQATRDAKRLLHASDHFRKKNSNKQFLKIMTSASFTQLAAICHEFKTIAGQNIEDYIWVEFDGYVREALYAIVEIARDGHPSFFARRLHQAMKGLGTDDNKLIRIIVTRSEIDLYDIAMNFYKKYKDRLSTWIKDDCSGYYRLCLLNILGSN